MTLLFIRSGPDNSRALWHIRSPTSNTGSGVLCGRSVSGPTVASLEAVEATGRPLCGRCDSRRDDLIRDAVFLLVALGVDMAVDVTV